MLCVLYLSEKDVGHCTVFGFQTLLQTIVLSVCSQSLYVSDLLTEPYIKNWFPTLTNVVVFDQQKLASYCKSYKTKQKQECWAALTSKHISLE